MRRYLVKIFDKPLKQWTSPLVDLNCNIIYKMSFIMWTIKWDSVKAYLNWVRHIVLVVSVYVQQKPISTSLIEWKIDEIQQFNELHTHKIYLHIIIIRNRNTIDMKCDSLYIEKRNPRRLITSIFNICTRFTKWDRNAWKQRKSLTLAVTCDMYWKIIV